MKIYVLKRYPTPHKWHGDEKIIGYFTSATALQRTLRKYKKVFGVYDNSGYDKAVASCDFYRIGWCSELASVEVITANERLSDVEEFMDDAD